VRLSSQHSQFIFNLPQSFLPAEVIETYTPILEKNWIQYENVIDYLNSTIKSVNFPGISFDMPTQIRMRGKQRNFKPATNPQDIITTRQLQVTFRSVDSDLNYWLMFDILNKHYLDVENQWLDPFTITAVDSRRDGIYAIKFYEIIINSLSENMFNYSQQRVTSKDFVLTFNFNFYDIEFLLDKSKVLELGSIPQIIQKI
jgi:hypothetical protein